MNKFKFSKKLMSSIAIFIAVGLVLSLASSVSALQMRSSDEDE